MNANAWIALAGLVFSGFVVGMVKLAFTVGEWRERLASAEKDLAESKADQAKLLEAIEEGDCAIKARLAEALAQKVKSHDKLHRRADEIADEVTQLRTDHERLKSRCDTIHGPPSQVVMLHDTYREDPHE